MKNNSLIETENSDRGLVLIFVLHLFLFFFFFLIKRCCLKIVVPRFKILKKRHFIISAESLKNTLKVFLSKVAGLLAET